jgi:hypothetical protein
MELDGKTIKLQIVNVSSHFLMFWTILLGTTFGGLDWYHLFPIYDTYNNYGIIIM